MHEKYISLYVQVVVGTSSILKVFFLTQTLFWFTAVQIQYNDINLQYNITIYFITTHYIALIFLATLTIQFLFFFNFLIHVQENNKNHYRYTLQERKKKKLDKKIVSPSPY